MEEEVSNKISAEIVEKGWFTSYQFSDILGESSEITRAIKLAEAFAKTDNVVLITGESGTGKELFAQSIHAASDRATEPFFSMNCGVFNDNLFESELFGYVGGAFTGANKKGKKGLIECANRGTLFLDEICNTPMASQAKLLRVIQGKQMRRIGSDVNIPIDVRIICATNKDLLDEIECGAFRADLYYRLSELELFIPPLRERKGDIVILSEAFLNRELKKTNRALFWKDKSVFYPLLQHNWPGNVRELKNFFTKLVVYWGHEEITMEAVNLTLDMISRKKSPKMKREITISISKDLKMMEKEILCQLLSKVYYGDKERLCQDYGISKMTLWRKLNYQI